MAGVSFKQFIAEGYHAELRDKLLQLKTEIAADLGMPRHRVLADRRAMGNMQQFGYVLGIRIRIPDDEAASPEFFKSMAVLSAKKALGKLFDRYRIEDIDIVGLDTGNAIWMTVEIPDFDGLMSDDVKD